MTVLQHESNEEIGVFWRALNTKKKIRTCFKQVRERDPCCTIWSAKVGLCFGLLREA